MSDPEVPAPADAVEDLLGAFEESLRAALGQREPDTPAQQCSHWVDADQGRCFDCGATPPATPEGGELDDLLRWADEFAGSRDVNLFIAKRVGDLASALRSQREQLTDERRRVEVFRTAANVSHAAVVKLERELAEVRDTRSHPHATRLTTSEYVSDGGGLMSWLTGWVNVPPNTEVVVVRAAEDKETPDA